MNDIFDAQLGITDQINVQDLQRRKRKAEPLHEYSAGYSASGLGAGVEATIREGGSGASPDLSPDKRRPACCRSGRSPRTKWLPTAPDARMA